MAGDREFSARTFSFDFTCTRSRRPRAAARARAHGIVVDTQRPHQHVPERRPVGHRPGLRHEVLHRRRPAAGSATSSCRPRPRSATTTTSSRPTTCTRRRRASTCTRPARYQAHRRHPRVLRGQIPAPQEPAAAGAAAAPARPVRHPDLRAIASTTRSALHRRLQPPARRVRSRACSSRASTRCTSRSALRSDARTPDDWSVGAVVSLRPERRDRAPARQRRPDAAHQRARPELHRARRGPMCGTPSAPVFGCVPLNLLSGAGSASPEALAYAGFTGTTRAQIEEQTSWSRRSAGCSRCPAAVTSRSRPPPMSARTAATSRPTR